MKKLGLAFGIGLVVGACSKAPEPTPAPAQKVETKPGTSAPASGASAATPADVTFEAPPSWSSVPNPSPMRKATFKIPKVAGDADDAELAVSAASGGVEPNVKRWAMQFGNAPAKTETQTVNGLKVTTVELKGTFNGGMPMGASPTPKDKQMLLGAIVDLGSQQHFFKIVGPEKTVAAAKPDFDKLVASFRGK